MQNYYTWQFRHDVSMFMPQTSVPYFGHAWSRTCREQLFRIPAGRRPKFLICLYFTVLVDQAVYTHFPMHYDRFEALTKYPKFCHGLSQFQHNPRGILLTPVDLGVVPQHDVLAEIASGMSVFVDEVINFLRDYMPALTAREFFDALLHDPDVQIPLLVILVNQELKNDVGVVAYQELCAAVARAVTPTLNS